MSTIKTLKLLIRFITIGSIALPIMVHAQDNIKWKPLKFSGIKQNEFLIHENGSIDIFMDDSSSLLYRDISKTEMTTNQRHWQWKIEQGFVPTSMADSAKDDRPVAVHIWFPKDKTDKNKGFKEPFDRLLGYDFPGRVITYVFHGGGTEQHRDIIENPHFEDRGYIVIQKSGLFESNDWVNKQ